jgi:hypothetical protein
MDLEQHTRTRGGEERHGTKAMRHSTRATATRRSKKTKRPCGGRLRRTKAATNAATATTESREPPKLESNQIKVKRTLPDRLL